MNGPILTQPELRDKVRAGDLRAALRQMDHLQTQCSAFRSNSLRLVRRVENYEAGGCQLLLVVVVAFTAPNNLPKKPFFFFCCWSGGGGAGPGWVGAAAACVPTGCAGNAGIPFTGVPGATVACLPMPKIFWNTFR